VACVSAPSSVSAAVIHPTNTSSGDAPSRLTPDQGHTQNEYPLSLLGLPPLMDATSGIADVVVGLVDGPVAVDHPELTSENIRITPKGVAACSIEGQACAHGTFVAGILSARRGAGVPAICPDCTLVVRPIFEETSPGVMPSATPRELAAAITECVDAGARLVNVSAAVTGGHGEHDHVLVRALDHVSRQGVLVIAAAGNDRGVGSSIVTRHAWVLPVVAYSRSARPMDAFFGGSVGRRGLGAPGEKIRSLAPAGRRVYSGGTSAATPFVTGTAALIWSLFPDSEAATVKFALQRATQSGRRGIVPPLLDAWSAYRLLASMVGR